jgi:hypothetical protein
MLCLGQREAERPTDLHDSSKISHTFIVLPAEDIVALLGNLFTNFSPKLVLNVGVSRKLEESPGERVGGCLVSCSHERADKVCKVKSSRT